jgi:hypothetical protein
MFITRAEIRSKDHISITSDFLEFKPPDSKNAKIITNNHVIDLDLLYETVQLLAERLAVLAADEDVVAKHPSLRDAYNQYQLLSNLITPNKKDEL